MIEPGEYIHVDIYQCCVTVTWLPIQLNFLTSRERSSIFRMPGLHSFIGVRSVRTTGICRNPRPSLVSCNIVSATTRISLSAVYGTLNATYYRPFRGVVALSQPELSPNQKCFCPSVQSGLWPLTSRVWKLLHKPLKIIRVLECILS